MGTIGRRWLQLLALAGCCIGLAYAVHRLLPPAPRLSLDIAGLGQLTADGRRFVAPLASGNPEVSLSGPINVWDTHTGRIIGSFLHDISGSGRGTDMGPAATGPLVKVQSLPTGFLAFQFAGALLIVENGDPTPRFSERVRHFAFSPDGSTLLVDDWNSTKVWNLLECRLEKEVPRMQGPYLFTEDGRRLATTYFDANDVWKAALWNMPDLTRHALVSPNVAHLIDRPRLMLSHDDRWLSIQFSTVDNNRLLSIELLDVASGQVIARPAGLAKSIPYAFSQDGSAAALLGDDLSEITVVDLPSSKPLWSRKSKVVGTHVPSDTIMINDVANREIVFLDWRTGQPRGGSIRHPAHPADVALSGEIASCHGSSPGMWVLPQQRDEPSVPRWPTWLQNWIPALGWSHGVIVADVPSGETLLIIKRPENAEVQVSKDARTLLIRRLLETGPMALYRYEFWAVPARPRWGWVFGVPAALLLLIVLARFMWRRRGPARLAQVQRIE